MDNRIKNIYWMLVYAFNALTEKETKNIKIEEFDNVANLLAAILIKTLNYQLKRGLNKKYITEKDSRSNLKGKILISDSIKYNTMVKHKMICEYDEFSINSYINKIIKATLLFLLKSKDLKKGYKDNIKRILLFFYEIDLIDVTTIEWENIKYDRNNITYKLIVNVCYLVLEGMLFTNEEGEQTLTDFIDEQKMSVLYEKFVKEYYRRHFPILKATSLHIDWNIGKKESVGLLPNMKTDITLTYKGKILIIDTKYYGKTLQTNTLYNKKTIISGNVYQIFTYVKNKDVNDTGNVSGMLLYAKTDEELVPNQTNTFGKNIITIRTLDLTVDFDNVANQLDMIAYELSNNELHKENCHWGQTP